MARRQLYVFGCAGDGQLGFRPNVTGNGAEMMLFPHLVYGAPTGEHGVTVKAIASGEKHTLFLADDGKVWSCGSNYNGELGRGGVKEGSYTIYPVHISNTVTIIQISAGRSHSMAVSDDGRLFAWGSNSHGQLAMSIDVLNSDIPKRVPSLPETVQVACGASHTVSLNGGGRVFIWGQQSDGRIRYSPAEVEIFISIPVIQISAGNLFTMVLTASGTLFAWGKNEEGQLGDFTNRDASNPCEIPNINSVVTVECGDSHAIALTHEGRVFSCGSDSFGQLGCGQPSRSQNCMRAITEMLGSHVTRIACGRCHTIVVANGKMHTFGLNSNGQLGHGNTRNQITPRVIDSVTNVSSVFAGWDQSFCLQVHTKHAYEVLSGPNCYLQKPKYLSLRRIRELFSFADKLTIIGELESVFSSLSSLNASFLYENEKRYRCSASNSCLDLDHVVQASSIISENIDADQYAEIMLSSLDASGMWELSWEKINSLESLRVYLILPSLYLFSSPSYSSVKALHLPFVRSIQLLRETDRKILDKWWSLFERRHFNRLVSALVKALEQLVEYQPNNTSDAIPFCSILSRLNAINRSQKLIAYDKFYVHNLQQKVDMANDLAKWEFSDQQDVFYWSNYPFLLNAELKTNLLQLEARIQMQISMSTSGIMILPFNISLQPHPFFELSVHRDNIVDDAMVALLSSKEMDLKKPLKVHFIGEEADDAGGVKKEFFMLLFQELLQPKYGMFTENDESHLIWFSGVETDPLSFKLVGRLCALAVYNSVLIDFPFPLALYKKILDVPLELEDLSELSPAEGRSLRSLLDYEEDDIEEVFCLTFMISISVLGDSKDIELKTNGAEIPVNQKNKHEFVQLYIRKRLEEGCDGEITQQLRWFTEGFGSAMHSKIMNFFQPQELMEMVVGNENYDWNLFRMNTEYKGVYHARHEAIICFWEVFFELNIAQRKKFLQFLMGSTRIPIQGMSAVKMRIQPCDEKALPVAHTCFNLLDLPNITDRGEMRRRILICLDNSHGFNLV
uniref:HECT domain-containing protein n=3 Tax=Onchocerca TaxID=6281 RepID=A0A8R1XQ80_ONCVO